MNTKRTTMGWLVLAAALIIGMTACSKEENLTEEPTTAAGVQVTVSAGMDDGATTRADVTEAVVEGKTQRTLKFTAGDRLYIWRYISGNYLNGILTMDGEPTGGGLGATFSGTLKVYNNYNEEITDYDYTSLGSDPLTGSTAILIPSGAASGCFNEASHTGAPFKENYSIAADVNTLMKTALYVAGDYNGSGYTLTKRYPILNCNLGGLTAGKTYSVTLGATLDQDSYTYGLMDAQIAYTPTVTANGGGNVSFAISGTNLELDYDNYWFLRLDGGICTYDYIIGQKQFEAKVYNVTRATPNATSIVAEGQVIGDDGKSYDYDDLPGGVTALAKICYFSGGHGLALALDDEGQMDWSTAITTCAAHTPTIPGGTWKLASQDEWNQMISAAGDYEALRDGFESVGGTNMQSAVYWSSTEGPVNTIAYRYKFGSGDWDLGVKTQDNINTRACLSF
jgi:hypothetical protein